MLFAANFQNNCAGFIYYLPCGAFHSFPYLHLIAVAEEYRGKGISRSLMEFLRRSQKAQSSFCRYPILIPGRVSFTNASATAVSERWKASIAKASRNI